VGVQQTRKFYEDRAFRLSKPDSLGIKLSSIFDDLLEPHNNNIKIGKICHCKFCGKEIYKPNSKLERNIHFFCSKLCYMSFKKHSDNKFISFENKTKEE